MKFKRRRRHNKQLLLTQAFLVLLLFIGIGYSILNTSLGINGTIQLAKANCEVNNKLYNVLRCEYEKEGIFVTKYEGKHGDSMANSGNKKIYYFTNPDSYDEMESGPIEYKTNVKFGDKCWKMIRTTDTGGVKIIYNGLYNEQTKCNNTGNSATIGESEFNDSPAAMSYVGYMYNNSYEYKTSDSSKWGKKEKTKIKLDRDEYNITYNNQTYPFIWDDTNKTWTSTMRTNNKSSSIRFGLPENDHYYIGYDISSEANYDKATFSKKTTELKTVSGINSGTIDLGNLTADDYIDVLYSKDSRVNAGRDNVIFSVYKESDQEIDNRYKFGNDFTYENGVYKLKNVIKAEKDDDLSTHHYTCLNSTGECTSIKYLNYKDDSDYYYYIELENGKSVDDAISEMLYDENVNSTSSFIKTYIENWYENNMLDYDKYLEDTVFCYDRSIANREISGFNPNGGDYSTALEFTSKRFPTDLSCSNITDKFSILNDKAKIKYKVGLLSVPEAVLSENINILNIDYSFFLGSPMQFQQGFVARVATISNEGFIVALDTNAFIGIRPVISLKPGTEFTTGDGSTNNPYIVKLD